MQDDEFDDLPEDLSVGDPDEFLDRLDSGFAELGVQEQPPAGPLSRQEIDDIVERAIAEELARLSAPASKPA